MDFPLSAREVASEIAHKQFMPFWMIFLAFRNVVVAHKAHELVFRWQDHILVFLQVKVIDTLQPKKKLLYFYEADDLETWRNHHLNQFIYVTPEQGNRYSWCLDVLLIFWFFIWLLFFRFFYFFLYLFSHFLLLKHLSYSSRLLYLKLEFFLGWNLPFELVFL